METNFTLCPIFSILSILLLHGQYLSILILYHLQNKPPLFMPFRPLTDQDSSGISAISAVSELGWMPIQLGWTICHWIISLAFFQSLVRRILNKKGSTSSSLLKDSGPNFRGKLLSLKRCKEPSLKMWILVNFMSEYLIISTEDNPFPRS